MIKSTNRISYAPFIISCYILFGCLLSRHSSAGGADNFCKDEDELPHQQQFWGADFPYTGKGIRSICDGRVKLKKNGQVCVKGQVSFGDIRKALKKPILAPSNDGITVAGLLISGSPHWWRGTELTHAIDYVQSYKVNGTKYKADSSITDRIMAASRGTLDEVCFDPSFVKDEYFYDISHKFWFQGLVNTDKFLDGQFLFVSNLFVAAEYLEKRDKPPLVDYGTKLVTLQRYLAEGLFPNAEADDSDSVGSESSFFDLLPFTMNSFGPLARVWVNGPTSSLPHPSPTLGQAIESIQIDTEWETFEAAIQDGLFTKYGKPPKEIYVAIKKLEPGSDNPIGCWKSTSADLSFGALRGRGDLIDNYVNDIVFPALDELGTVGMHLGKRVPAKKKVTREALRRYKRKCGVELDVTPETCYHPMCNRKGAPTDFIYPPAYYAATDSGQSSDDAPARR